MKNKDIEKRFEERYWKRIKNMRNRVKSGKQLSVRLFAVMYDARKN